MCQPETSERHEQALSAEIEQLHSQLELAIDSYEAARTLIIGYRATLGQYAKRSNWDGKDRWIGEGDGPYLAQQAINGKREKHHE
jgi:hypothetical protein